MRGRQQHPSAFSRVGLISILCCCGVLIVSVQGFQLPNSHALTQNSYASSFFDSKQRCAATSGEKSNFRKYVSPVHPYSQRRSILEQSAKGASNESENSPGKRRRAAAMVKSLVGGTLRRFLNAKTRMVSNFKRLSKRSKILVVAYLMVFTFFLGSIGRSAYISHKNHDFPVNRKPIEITYSSFMDIVEQQKDTVPGGTETNPSMDRVRISPDRISFRLSKPAGEDDKVKYLTAYTRKPPASPEILNYLRSNKLEFSAASNTKNIILVYGLRSLLFTLYGLFLWRMLQTMRGATGGGTSNADVPGKLLQQTADGPIATFQDIQGIDAAKNEVMELVDTLRNPDKYAILGARAPTGLLLEGPPGTGKTMLARATAATAGVPLLYCSGSDFIELYVGRGAGRVRRLFERANKLAPCIIFVDELDTLGKARDSGSGLLGNMPSRANDEAEQTLNQLLTCMDGLDSNKRICVLAATNRKEVLDPALVRPGRFDRIVTLRLPDAKGRENILRVHASKLPGFEESSGIDPNRLNSLGKGNKVDLSAVAAVLDGLSGAELEFVVNEAAIRAVRRVSAALRQGKEPGTPHVNAEDFEASVANFVETRSKGSGKSTDFVKNIFK